MLLVACSGWRPEGKACSPQICFLQTASDSCVVRPPRCCGGASPFCGGAFVAGQLRALELVSESEVDAGACLVEEAAPCID